jgi:two-component system phosphate regulon sensor histidine kinase PhoR
MKKWKIYTVVAIVSIALFGLIYVQSIFIQRSVIIQEQVFFQYVQDALHRVAVQIEEKEAVNFINKTTDINPSYNANFLNDKQDESYSLQFKDNVYTATIIKNDSSFVVSATDLLELDQRIKSLNLDLNILSNQEEMNKEYANYYSSMFNNMNFQVFLDDEIFELSTDSQELHTLLDFELKRVGITTPFKFALLEEFSLKEFCGNCSKLTPELFKKAFKAPVLLNGIIGTQAILLIDFPKKKRFILKSNSKLLIFSFIFIFLIVASFVISWYIIFKQKKLSELKTDFINNMTHELKTPVATISLATEMLSKEKVQNKKDKLNNYIKIINDENQRLGNHIERVLQTAQLDKESISLNKERIDLHDLLCDLNQKFKLRIIDASATVTWQLEASNPMINGDKVHLLNVLSNLVDNALKYRRAEDLTIDINTYNKNGSIFFEIKDNGIGMTNADSKRIFEKFYRVPTGNIHNVKGFGLGLSYVKTMIEEHEGKVTIDSELKKYTQFTIDLNSVK